MRAYLSMALRGTLCHDFCQSKIVNKTVKDDALQSLNVVLGRHWGRSLEEGHPSKKKIAVVVWGQR